MRSFLATVAILLAGAALAGDSGSPELGTLTLEDVSSARERLLNLTAQEAVVIDAACCKMCRKGKACGDSCISRSYQCHKGPGCACDG